MKKLIIALTIFISTSSFASSSNFDSYISDFTNAIKNMPCEDMKGYLKQVSHGINVETIDSNSEELVANLKILKVSLLKAAECIN